MTRNWKPVIESLLDVIAAHHIYLHAVHNGDGFKPVVGGSPEERRTSAIDLISDVDQAMLQLASGDHLATMLLMFDGNPEDLITVWSIPRSESFERKLEAAAEAFSSRWQGKPCPILERVCYWAITGRIPFDDEDTAFATPRPCTEDEAVAAFRQWMLDEALGDSSEQELRDRCGAPTSQPLEDSVYITSSFYSDSPINHK